MPNSKNYALREQVIDEWLQVDRGVNARDLMKACNYELRRNGFTPVTHVNTSKPKVYDIFPYFLKQFAHRWYLLAGVDGALGTKIFALDRVKVVERRFVHFREYEGKDFGELFGDMVGVSNYDVEEVETVTLWVDIREVPWFETLPLHPSQCIKERYADHAILTLRVKLNYELIQLLLSHAKYIKVLGPERLRDEIREILEFQQMEV